MGQLTQPLHVMSHAHVDSTWQPELGLSRLDHDVALMIEIAQMIESAFSSRLSAMENSALRHDFESLRQHTHSQLPSLKLLGFDQQAKVFEAFESAVVMADEIACRQLSPIIQGMWRDIIESLNAYLKSPKFKSCT